MERERAREGEGEEREGGRGRERERERGGNPVLILSHCVPVPFQDCRHFLTVLNSKAGVDRR